ncbi:MAG: CHAP domain-containing protein [Candidatus Saccharimonadales bacterium]
MKQRSTTPAFNSSSFAAKAALVACAVLMAVATPVQMGNTVFANYDEQIQAEKNKASKNQAQAEELSQMADSYQAELAQLESQARSLQKQISDSEKRRDKLEKDIKANEKKVVTNKSALGDTIVDLQMDSETSTLEMVASSRNLSDFVDRQSQQTAIQNKLNDTINEINRLKEELAKQQKAVEQEIQNQKAQRQQLAAKEAEKASLVKETRGQEGKYREKAKKNNDKVNQLQAAQAEENRRAAMAAMAAANQGGGGGAVSIPSGSAGGGGYPGAWANAPINSYVDSWGLYSRQCVSYAAWKVASTGRYVPHFAGAGNANQWPSTVAAHGIPSGSAPRAGSVAMMPIGYYGHVMYVESVNSDGTITVSDYNLEWDGLYRIYTRSAAGLTYIYF